MDSIVLITGASSGIGKSTVNTLLEKGYVVYGTSRNWNDILTEKETNYYQIKLDVTDDNSVSNCVKSVLKKEGKIDVLINNAGFGYVSPLMYGTVNHAKDQFETNFFGIIRVIENVMPSMISQKKGKIINIGSIGGRIAIPYQGLYSASKSALAIYSDALRMESKKFNIQVSTVEPGDTRTDFNTRRKVIEENIPENVKNEMLKALTIMRKAEDTGTNSKKVAKLIYNIVKSKKTKSRYTVGNDAKIVNYGTRLFPKGVIDRLIGSNYKISNNMKTEN